jgi:hypoxanthine phosphoribosyltransferase
MKTLLSEVDLAKRIRELGVQISYDYRNAGIDRIVALGILKGSFMFMADLVRSITVDCECEFLGVSSYGNATETSGEVKLTHDVSAPLRDKHVLIVEDIADTGLTLQFLQKTFASRGVASLKTVVLLHKPEKKVRDCKLDYVGFKIGNEFVIGYGLDHAGLKRNLPFVAVHEE